MRLPTLVITVLILFTSQSIFGMNSVNKESMTEFGQQNQDPPDLVIGIIIDQFRPDYIYRYWDNFGDDGFKRLVNEGHNFRNAWFRYLQTSTGSGHAAHLTGSTPAIHGLIGNNFYIRNLDRRINVVEDVSSGYQGVGTQPGYDGQKSPANMLTTTVGDELFLHTNKRSKTIGISRKDRGAILPAGHTGKAFWYEYETGNFVTSSYYMDELPSWLKEFNSRELAQKFLTQTWDLLLPEEEYSKRSRPDENPYEGHFEGMSTSAFPINLGELYRKGEINPGHLNRTPFSDEMLTELAIATMEGGNLGKRGVSDILSISFSAVDGVGHRFGPASYQMQDLVIRLDRYIGRLLNYLDDEYGMENVLLYMSSDHGGAYIPHYLRDLGVATGNTDNETHVGRELRNSVERFLKDAYGENILLSISNQNIYLDHEFINEAQLDHHKVQHSLKRFLLSLNMIGGALTEEEINSGEFSTGIKAKVQHVFHQKHSGDVMYWLQPQTNSNTGTGGTGHGTGWAYDTHAPLILFGYDIPKGESTQLVHPSDIASTISLYLNSPFPSGNIGNPLQQWMKELGK